MDSILRKYKCKPGQPYTHTRIGDPSVGVFPGKYFIPEQDISSFYKAYARHTLIENCEEYLTEKQIENGPLLIDLDFRYSVDVEERQHTDDHIIEFIDHLLENLQKIYEFKEDNEINIHIFEKDSVNLQETVTKDGIHIMVNIKMEVACKLLLRNMLIESGPKIWGDLPLINSWDDVYDKAIMDETNNWQLYGSRKPSNEAYQLTSSYKIIYCGEDSEMDITKLDDKINWIDDFFKFSARHIPSISFEMKESIKSQYENILKSRKKRNFKQKMINKNKIKRVEDITCEEDLNDMVDEMVKHEDYNLKEIHEYTMILTQEFWGPGSFNNWIRVGWALKNTDDKCLLTWIKMSSQSDDFSYSDIDDIVNRWNNFSVYNEDGITKKSILYWAKLCNEDKFREVKKNTIDNYIEQTVKHNMEFDIAYVLYQMYKDRFVCASIKDNLWYEFIGNRWFLTDGGNTLRYSISTELYDLYYKKIMEINKQLRSLQNTDTLINNNTSSKEKKADSPEVDKLKNIKEIYERIAHKNLKQTTFKRNVMKEAQDIFWDKNFLKKMDKNLYLLCFNNCVIDFKNNEIRDGKPDDYITKCTNIDYYLSESDKNSTLFKNLKVNVLTTNVKTMDDSKFEFIKNEIDQFMDTLFPESNDEELCYKDVRRYMWEHLSSTLLGVNSNQTFNIYNGSGANGKSKLVELMEKILGDYKGTVPITLITQKRNGIGGTSSEVAQLIGVRYAVMQEPSKGDTINEGILKELTGGDPIQCRQLFRESQVFIPQFKLVVCTNTLFEVNSQDDGTWRRIRVVNFPSKFIKQPYNDDKYPRETCPFQYERDPKLDEKFESWVPVFMNLLTKIAFEKKGIVNDDCKKVKEKSDEYRRDKDLFNDFRNDCIQYKKGARINKNGLKEAFNIWFVDKYNKHERPNGKELYDWMDTTFGKCTRRGWLNYELVSQNSNANEDEIDLNEE